MKRFALLVLLLAATAACGCAARDLRTVAELDVAPGNITVTPSGRIILSLHQHYRPDLRVAELLDDGSLRAFPGAAWNDQDAPRHVNSVLGIQCDRNGRVWMLDNAMRGGEVRQLVAWDTRADRLHRRIPLPPPVSVEGSFLNDLAVDVAGGAVYIADPATPKTAALIVVDLAGGEARRVLQGHPSVTPGDAGLIVEGEPAQIRTEAGEIVRPRVGVNPIALDAEGEWLYFGPMTGLSLYRVRTADLRDASLSGDQLARRVQRYADKPICDGISIDREGNIYISEIGSSAIGVIDPEGAYRRLVRDRELLSWPDAFAYGGDGWMYTVANQLHRGPVLNAGVDASRPPYRVLKFRPLASGVVGR